MHCCCLQDRPPNRIDTYSRVTRLREAMADAGLVGDRGIDAYIIEKRDEYGVGMNDVKSCSFRHKTRTAECVPSLSNSRNIYSDSHL